MIDKNPSISLNEIGRILNIHISSLKREIIRRGGKENYTPQSGAYEVKPEIKIPNWMTGIRDEHKDFITRLNAYKKPVTLNKCRGRICYEDRKFIEENLRFKRLISYRTLGQALGVSDSSINCEVEKNGGVDLYNAEEAQFRCGGSRLPLQALESFDHVRVEIEALKMHINILYELINKLEKKNN